jgi:hypothetical protein
MLLAFVLFYRERVFIRLYVYDDDEEEVVLSQEIINYSFWIFRDKTSKKLKLTDLVPGSNGWCMSA